MTSQTSSERPREIVTSQGSRYRFLPDGTTQRFKTAVNELLEPQDAIVFIPPYDLLRKAYPNPEEFDKIFGENEFQFEQLLLKYVQTSGYTISIVNESGEGLNNNKEIQDELGRVFLAFGKKGEKCHFAFPVDKNPQIGYNTFDTRKFFDERKGEFQRERHIGNPVTEIIM